MPISRLRWRASLAVGAAAAAVLALAVPAGASTGPRYASAEQVGYAATGAQFSYIQGVVYLRKPVQYAGEVSHYSHSVQLWSSCYVLVVGVSASTSGSAYTPYAKVFDPADHQLLASDPRAEWCVPQGQCGTTIGTFPAGDSVVVNVSYEPGGGKVIFDAEDPSGFDFEAVYQAGTGESFTQARVGTEFGPDPWTPPSSYTHPAQWTKIAAYSHVRLVTYNERSWTLASWFVHHKIFMVGITGSLLDVQAAPTDLTEGGASFQNWLAPAGVNGPAQPPRAEPKATPAARPAASPGRRAGRRGARGFLTRERQT
jgi:hypothetical protein